MRWVPDAYFSECNYIGTGGLQEEKTDFGAKSSDCSSTTGHGMCQTVSEV
jgi:hypothetical protein